MRVSLHCFKCLGSKQSCGFQVGSASKSRLAKGWEKVPHSSINSSTKNLRSAAPHVSRRHENGSGAALENATTGNVGARRWLCAWVFGSKRGGRNVNRRISARLCALAWCRADDRGECQRDGDKSGSKYRRSGDTVGVCASQNTKPASSETLEF